MKDKIIKIFNNPLHRLVVQFYPNNKEIKVIGQIKFKNGEWITFIEDVVYFIDCNNIDKIKDILLKTYENMMNIYSEYETAENNFKSINEIEIF
jgi:hypothetical protein